MSGCDQPAARAAAADVPETESALSPAASVRASPGAITCSHACCPTGTAAPSRSVTDWMGLGGHQVPPDRMVADTLAISSVLTGLSPRVNDSRSRK
jgi:hypothetical protein